MVKRGLLGPSIKQKYTQKGLYLLYFNVPLGDSIQGLNYPNALGLKG